jgi:protease IV
MACHGSACKNPLEDFASLQRFVGLLPPKRPKGPHVALVNAVGNIIDGKGSGILGAREEIASRTLVAALRALTRDDDVKAVVLRIDSGGGSALASEQIWTAASELAEAKPLVVSMASVAASGGYYIASPAAKIYARENTLTGSIGVVGGKVVFGEALASLGVDTYAVKRGERALMWSIADRWTPSEREAVTQMMEITYERFLERVARGRSMERDAVHAIAQGRVWTGSDAKARGLVDELGGLDAALADAHRMAGLEPGALQVYPPEPTLRDIVASFGGVDAGPTWSLAAGGRDTLLGSAARTLGAELHGVEDIVRTLGDLRDSRIWAVSWVRPPR